MGHIVTALEHLQSNCSGSSPGNHWVTGCSVYARVHTQDVGGMAAWWLATLPLYSLQVSPKFHIQARCVE